MDSCCLCDCFLLYIIWYWYESNLLYNYVGANDVSNAFATSVGSKALTMKQATLIAAVMEFSGSFLLGGNVASTIMKGITEPSYFKDEPVFNRKTHLTYRFCSCMV